MKPYYNHDHIWQRRVKTDNPIWGSYSNKCYQEVVQHAGRFKLPPARVLDIGCGAGACGNWFRELGYEYLGVDESLTAIELGQKHFPQLELMHFDGTKPAPEDWLGAFDLAVSINVLHCLTEDIDRQNLLKLALISLRPHGALILTGMCLPKEDDFRQTDSPRCYKTPEDIAEEMLAAGFQTVEVLEFIPPQRRAKISNATLLARN